MHSSGSDTISATEIATSPRCSRRMLLAKICALLLLFSLYTLAFAEQTTAANAVAAKSSVIKPIVMFFGDSLSAAYGIKPAQGWVALAAPELAREGFATINASVSGETTAGGLARLPALLKKHQPALLVLALGANDGLRGLDPSQMQRNLRAMVQMAKAQQTQVLLVGIRIPPNFGPEYTTAFEAAFRQCAQEEKVSLLPFLLAPLATDRGAFQADALHPTAAAQPKIWAHVRANVLSELKKLALTPTKGR
jgi:acyl-CoA thioesterase I